MRKVLCDSAVCLATEGCGRIGIGSGRDIGKGFCGWLEGLFWRVEAKWLGMRMDGMKDRGKWDEIRKKRLLCLYYHSPILLLGFSYDAYMMLLSCSYVRG